VITRRTKRGSQEVVRICEELGAYVA